MRLWPRNRSIELGSPRDSGMRRASALREPGRPSGPAIQNASTIPANGKRTAQHSAPLKSAVGRMLSNRTLTLSIDDDAVRAVVFKGRRIVKWGFTSLTRTAQGNNAVVELRGCLRSPRKPPTPASSALTGPFPYTPMPLRSREGTRSPWTAAGFALTTQWSAPLPTAGVARETHWVEWAALALQVPTPA